MEIKSEKKHVFVDFVKVEIFILRWELYQHIYIAALLSLHQLRFWNMISVSLIAFTRKLVFMRKWSDNKLKAFRFTTTKEYVIYAMCRNESERDETWSIFIQMLLPTVL